MQIDTLIQHHIQALARFAETVASGATYEAQQVLKTVYHRLRSRGQLQQSYDLAARAAVTQFGAHQPTCGAELGIMMLTDFVTDGVQVAPAPLQLAMAVLDAPSPSDADELISLAKATLKWIVSCGGTRADAAQVHDAVAQRVCDAKGLAAATPFFVRATSLVPFAAAVQAAAREGLPQEQGLFFLRAVLQALLACDHVTEEGVARCAPLLNAFDGCEAPAAHLARLLLVVRALLLRVFCVCLFEHCVFCTGGDAGQGRPGAVQDIVHVLCGRT